MSILAQFKNDIRVFLKTHPKMTKTRFGLDAVGSSHAIFDWLSGKKVPRVDMVDKTYKFMREYKTL